MNRNKYIIFTVVQGVKIQTNSGKTL